MDKTVVLVIAGARLRQPYVLFREVLSQIMGDLSQFEDMHFAFLSGSDDEYADELRKVCFDHELDNVSVFNYVENMPELMNACDMAIAKSGGLAVTECLCAKLPIIIVGKSFGQERANTTTVTRAGAAKQVITAEDLLSELQNIQRDPAMLQAMIEGGSTLRRPSSAADVARATLDKVGKVGRKRNIFAFLYWGKKPLRVR